MKTRQNAGWDGWLGGVAVRIIRLARLSRAYVVPTCLVLEALGVCFVLLDVESEVLVQILLECGGASGGGA